jgi:hypothetical protein
MAKGERVHPRWRAEGSAAAGGGEWLAIATFWSSNNDDNSVDGDFERERRREQGASELLFFTPVKRNSSLNRVHFGVATIDHAN